MCSTAAAAVVSAADVMREVARALHSPAVSRSHSTPAPISAPAPVVDNRSSANAHTRFDESVTFVSRSSLTAAERHADRARLLACARSASNYTSLSKETTNSYETPNSTPYREVTGEEPEPSPFPDVLPARVVAEFCDLLAEDINACDHEGLTPLYRAASQGSREHVALLLSAPEIDVDAVGGRPMLMLTPAPTQVASLTVEAAPAPNGFVPPPPLAVTVESAAPATVVNPPAGAAALPEPPTPTAAAAVPEPPMPTTPTAAASRRRWHSSAMGATAALVAAFRGHYDILTQLVAHGANLTLKNKLGFSVMKLAKMNVKVRKAIEAGRALRERRLLSTGKALLSCAHDLPVDLAALVVSCTYQ